MEWWLHGVLSVGLLAAYRQFTHSDPVGFNHDQCTFLEDIPDCGDGIGNGGHPLFDSPSLPAQQQHARMGHAAQGQ